LHILHVPLVFLTNRTGEEKRLWLGLMTLDWSKSLTIFSISTF
jgi:hypothetical protein